MKLALVSLLVATAAAAEPPQPVTLDRTARGSRAGAQASFQLYPDFDDSYGLRVELHGQHAVTLANGSAVGAYGHLAVSHVSAPTDSVTALGSLEMGGLYVTSSRGVDLAFHLGLTLPTASRGDEALITNVVTHLERNHELVNVLPDEVALKVGATGRGQLGSSGFAQVDLAVDLGLRTAERGDHAPFFHANVGAGRWVGPTALLVELATCFFEGHHVGSVAVGARLRGPGRPHVAYVLAFADDESAFDPDGGIVAHILSVGVVTP